MDIPLKLPLSIAAMRALLVACGHVEPPAQIRPIGEGGDYQTFVVDERTVYRFARDQRCSDKLLREVAVLPWLAPFLPLAIPRVTQVALPGAGHPYAFAGYTLLPGISGERRRPTPAAWDGVAAALGRFFTCLHACSVDEARALGVPTRPAADPAAALRALAAYRAMLRRAAADILTARMEGYLAGTIAPPEARPITPVVCHGDLKGEHVLLMPDGTAIAGILDWSDLCLADPAVDFAGIFIWLGGAFAARMLRHYARVAHDEANDLWARARFWSQLNALLLLGERLAGASDAPLDLLRAQLHWAFAADER